MALCVCTYCGKAFNSYGSTECPECGKLLDEAYAKAKKYIYQNPEDSNFKTIVENTEVSEKALSYLISHKRIIIGSKMDNGLKCRICGRSVSDGVICEACRAKLISQHILASQDKPEREDVKREMAGVLPLKKKPKN
ncbi:MAG: hypothetical protein AB7D36_08200 [Oscillospiraceae bacterium]